MSRMPRKKANYKAPTSRPISSAPIGSDGASSSSSSNNYSVRTGQKRSRQFDDSVMKADGGWGGFEKRTEKRDALSDALDDKFGFRRITEGPPRLGWLINMHPNEVTNSESGVAESCVDLYFLQQDGDTYKVTKTMCPYFFISVMDGHLTEVEAFLSSRFNKHIHAITPVDKEDLDLANHLSGRRKTYVRIEFKTVSALLHVRGKLAPQVEKNRAQMKISRAYDGVEWSSDASMGIVGVTPEESDLPWLTNKAAAATASNRSYTSTSGGGGSLRGQLRTDTSGIEFIDDIRECDVPYYMRVSIDLDIRVGFWYTATFEDGNVVLTHRADLLSRAEPRVLAFDIETTKMPLKFPDAAIDSVMMISYMIDSQGYLIINRETVGQDVHDFEYTPKPEYPGQFHVFNEKNELDLLVRFFSHVRANRPHLYVTFNGDFFDWPFIEARALHYGLSMQQEIGVFKHKESGEYRCRFASHMDAFRWVMRDSYLPQGSQGLKAVTKAKLGYEPVEVDGEVSDAVATYYLYMKYVHPFIFSLCNIIPMNPDDVLRKGSGTLCEALLMVEAFKANVIFPNKQRDELGKMWKGHLLDGETYIGGHVEALQSGVFRSDLPVEFVLDPAAFQELMDELEETLTYALEVEGGMKRSEVTNFDQVLAQIHSALSDLRDRPKRRECPNIYHLDVAAMYPNIILTNRLQPSAIVTDQDCAVCDFNNPENQCKRKMIWTWRGTYVPAQRSEYDMVRRQLESERFIKQDQKDDDRDRDSRQPAASAADEPPVYVGFHELSQRQQEELLMKRLKEYSRKVYKRTTKEQSEERQAIVCMRENSFYVDTVRAFRDRRYTYKTEHKNWQRNLGKATSPEAVAQAQNMIVLYDSLQLAHKCILNSFYGYVMRRGARWFSMEMAGIVTHTGSLIIKQSRLLLERVGTPLELDTDGVWTLLPATFPENFEFTGTGARKSFVFSYPCIMLNARVEKHFKNEQYQVLVRAPGPAGPAQYEFRSECSIQFEVDGPYRAMVLPASKEEGKKLKKRYAVFNKDKTLAELKGFEMKRRGELKLVKVFQSQVFESFLEGDTLGKCYEAVGKVANQWMDVLFSHGKTMADDDLLSLISCSNNMSRSVKEYGAQKSTALTTAKRLAEFLGDEILRGQGLQCTFIISSKPAGAPIADRAIPVAIFQAEATVQRYHLRRWCKDNSIDQVDVRELVDWDYYIERVGSTIQKIITIPAVLQNVANPVPRVPHPEWLRKRISIARSQRKLHDLQGVIATSTASASVQDIESLGEGKQRARPLGLPVVRRFNDRSEDYDSGLQASSSSSSSSGTATSKSKKKGATKANGSKKPEKLSDDFPSGRCPEQETDFQGWLRWQKQKWRAQRQLRKAKKAAKEGAGARAVAGSWGRSNVSRRSAGFGAAPLASRSDLMPFFKQQQSALLHGTWEVLQLTKPRHAPVGVYRLWTLVRSSPASYDLYPVLVRVPRRFYLETTKSAEQVQELLRTECGTDDIAAVAVERHLPRTSESARASSVPVSIVQVSMAEEVWQAHLKSLTGVFSRPEMFGVFETKCPPEYRALLSLGHLCRLKESARAVEQAPADKCFDLDDIERQEQPHRQGGGTKKDTADAAEHEYLDMALIRHVFIYHSFTERRGILGVHLPHQKRAVVVLVASGGVADRAQVQRAFAREEAGTSVTVEVVDSNVAAYDVLQQLLQEYRRQRRGPAVVLAQCWGLEAVLHNTAALEEFPLIRVPVNQADNREAFPAFRWESTAARFFIQRFRDSGVWLGEQRKLCTYAQVPIGNVDDDAPLFMADVLYGRALQKQKHVLWATGTGRPDLGHDLVEALPPHHLLHPEVSQPNCYTDVCVELQLRNLVINTILESHHVHELEGATAATGGLAYAGADDGAGAGDDDASLLPMDETAQCWRAFRVFKALATKVSVDIGDDDASYNRFADMLVDHLYRWVSSPTSRLYDPSLHALVHNLTKKVFIQLRAELQKLGAKIVYATFNKLIICTSKSTRHDGAAYCDFILNAIKQAPLFSWLSFEVLHSWEVLLFVDSANYGGVITAENAASDDTQHAEEHAEEHDLAGELGTNQALISRWNLSEHLNDDGAKQQFQVVVSDYILKIFKYYHHHDDDNEQRYSSGSSQPSKLDSSTSSLASSTDEPPSRMGKKATHKHIVSQYLSQRLMRIIHDIQRTVPHDEKENSQGSSSLALAFITYVCHVLAVDGTAASEVSKLRKNLLRLVGVGEFANVAKFTNPCRSYILPDVICSFCSAISSMDLLRDAHVLAGKWECHNCGNKYNKSLIEKMLVDIVQHESLAFQKQDLVCTKCGLVKAENMAAICSQCSSSFQCRQKASTLRESLEVFKKIAEVYSFEWLEEVTEWLLQ